MGQEARKKGCKSKGMTWRSKIKADRMHLHKEKYKFFLKQS